jgi:hypothetical protein
MNNKNTVEREQRRNSSTVTPCKFFFISKCNLRSISGSPRKPILVHIVNHKGNKSLAHCPIRNSDSVIKTLLNSFVEKSYQYSPASIISPICFYLNLKGNGVFIAHQTLKYLQFIYGTL